MADQNIRLPENTPGPYYIDSTCIDCDQCRTTAPNFFRRHDGLGLSVVFRQPVTTEELKEAEEALKDCPTESIGNDG